MTTSQEVNLSADRKILLCKITKCSNCLLKKLKTRIMGNNSSLMLQPEEVEEIEKETGFSKNQILRLYSRFTNLDKGSNGSLSREDFLRIPELAINPLGDRIVSAFFTDSAEEDRVNFRQFMRVLARFRPIKRHKPSPLNSRDDKLAFAFGLYDLDNNGFISRDELLTILQMMVGANISTEQLQNIADRTIAEADMDGDGKISLEEFKAAMEKTEIEQKMSIRFLH